MLAKSIKDKESFTKYICVVDKANLNKYLKLLNYFELHFPIHDFYKLSSYIFQKIENRLDSINNLYNYFLNALRSNIIKLNSEYFKNKKQVPSWFNKKIDIEPLDYKEQAEMQEIIDSFK